MWREGESGRGEDSGASRGVTGGENASGMSVPDTPSFEDTLERRLVR